MGVVTGPFHKVTTTETSHKESSTYKQTKPRDKPNPYYSFEIKTSGARQNGDVFVVPPASMAVFADVVKLYGDENYSLTTTQTCYSRCYDKLASKCKGGSGASLGVALAESKQSLRMIAGRATSLYHVVNGLRTGNLNRVYKALTLRGDESKRAKAILTNRKRSGQDVSATLLELNFGWIPMINDIYSAIETLQSDLPHGRIEKVVSMGDRSLRPSRNGSDFYWSLDEYDSKVLVSLRAKTSVANPNLALANKLGLVNPAQIAFDAFPLSFMLNWFVPISGFLGSYSAFWGFKIEDIWRTDYRIVSQTSWSYYAPNGGGPSFRRAKGYRMNRGKLDSLDVPTFKSRFKLPTGHLLGKATNSVALLVQQLSKTNKR